MTSRNVTRLILARVVRNAHPTHLVVGDAHVADRHESRASSSGSNLYHVTRWSNRWQHPAADEVCWKLRHHERTGRPQADENFQANLEGLLERVLKPREPGRKPKKQEK